MNVNVGESTGVIKEVLFAEDGKVFKMEQLQHGHIYRRIV